MADKLCPDLRIMFTLHRNGLQNNKFTNGIKHIGLNLRPLLIAFVPPSLLTPQWIICGISFKCFCLSILSAIPSKVVNDETSHLWITPVIKRLSKRKQCVYNKARLSHHQDDWAQYYNLKRECQRECHRAYNNYVTNLVYDNNKVSK